MTVSQNLIWLSIALLVVALLTSVATAKPNIDQELLDKMWVQHLRNVVDKHIDSMEVGTTQTCVKLAEAQLYFVIDEVVLIEPGASFEILENDKGLFAIIDGENVGRIVTFNYVPIKLPWSLIRKK